MPKYIGEIKYETPRKLHTPTIKKPPPNHLMYFLEKYLNLSLELIFLRLVNKYLCVLYDLAAIRIFLEYSSWRH